MLRSTVFRVQFNAVRYLDIGGEQAEGDGEDGQLHVPHPHGHVRPLQNLLKIDPGKAGKTAGRQRRRETDDLALLRACQHRHRTLFIHPETISHLQLYKNYIVFFPLMRRKIFTPHILILPSLVLVLPSPCLARPIFLQKNLII
jgi:hypothetical protein